MSYEQPVFESIAHRDGYEVRYYPSYLVAETDVPGSFDGSGSTAFRRLASYIFGDNSESQKMNMTVPVTRTAAPGGGGYRYRFVMERAYSEESLPRPSDHRVVIDQVAAGHYAARRYRGRTNERRFRAEETKLRAALARDGVATGGAAAAAVYNGPFTPPPLRHNEVLIPIEWTSVRDTASR